LLLHVADGSNPAVLQQISSAYRVLEEIGIEGKDTILVINKIDRIADRRRVDTLLDRYPQALPISAQTGEGLAQLTQMVSELLARKFIEVDVETTVDNARVAVFVKTHGEVFSQRYHHENRLTIRCRLPEEYLSRIERLGASVHRTRSNGSGQEENLASELRPSSIEPEPTGAFPGDDHE
ncbi:MAG: hypothetical protein H5U08_17440, partial [Thermogutta sp.]|nr:hypothetical protein [Thermogutta sp.]